MVNEPIQRCDVCGKIVPHINVAASSCGPVSFAYCDSCLAGGYEPYAFLVSYVACAGKYPDDINTGFKKRVILPNLAFHKKTEVEFAADVEAAIKDMEAAGI